MKTSHTRIVVEGYREPERKSLWVCANCGHVTEAADRSQEVDITALVADASEPGFLPSVEDRSNSAEGGDFGH
ncbi:MAG: hypothetical protein R2682_08690 [Pyrinomonadaceae bacterium]